MAQGTLLSEFTALMKIKLFNFFKTLFLSKYRSTRLYVVFEYMGGPPIGDSFDTLDYKI